MLKVKLDDGTVLIFLGETLDHDAALVADIEDYRYGRLSYAHWVVGRQEVLRFMVRISGRPVVVQDLGPSPSPTREGLATIQALLEEVQRLGRRGPY